MKQNFKPTHISLAAAARKPTEYQSRETNLIHFGGKELEYGSGIREWSMKVQASIAAGQSLTADDIDTVMKLMPKWVAGFRRCVFDCR